MELVGLAAYQHRLAVRVRNHRNGRRSRPAHNRAVGHDGSCTQDDLMKEMREKGDDGPWMAKGGDWRLLKQERLETVKAEITGGTSPVQIQSSDNA